MGWIDTELVLVTIAAALSPTTLTFSTFVLVLSRRPLRSGFWFYLGALTATLAIGVLAAFVLGNVAASSHPSTPKTWVAIVDIVAAALILVWVLRVMRRPRNPKRIASMMEQVRGVTDSRAIAVIGAGATLANPGGFIPLALKEISELDPSRAGYVVDWLFFTLVSLLPLASALVLLLIAPKWTQRMLERARSWLDLHARTVAAAIVVLVAVTLLRNGIAGLTA
ncbi:MAG TPA: GAP family protein [Gaiellaceae bacterium]